MRFRLQNNQRKSVRLPESRSSATTLVVMTLLVLPFLGGCSQKIDTHAEFVELAYQHERTGKLPEAVVAYRKALELDPNSASTWYDLGVAFAGMEQFPEAIEAYSKAIELDSAMDHAFNNRAAAYAALKQLEQATQDCDRAIALKPDDYLAWRNRGLAHHDLGNPDKAQADYDESIRLNGRSATTYLYRGNVYLERKTWQRALEDFNHAVHLDEKLAAAWHSRAKALVQLGRRSDAEESSATAMNLGADVSDVFPDEPHSEAGPVASRDQTDPAVEYVEAWLNEQKFPVVASEPPWDLRGTGENESRGYIVRVVSSTMTETDVRFTDRELRQLELTNDIVPVLVIAEKLPTTGSESGMEPFRILRNIENWRPDFSVMKPLVWSFPVEEKVQTESIGLAGE